MQALVVGATGATGRLLVQQLLERGIQVRAIVRSPGKLPEAVREHAGLSVIQASILDLGETELADHVRGCAAIASCLGHTLSWRGVFGQPRRLVTDATRKLCQAIVRNRAGTPTKFVLMNTVANRNREFAEPVSFAHRCVIGLLRLFLPPHVDNEQAADYLRTQVGQTNEAIQWVAVRPDALTDEAAVSAYELHPSPIRSAIFDPGKTSRINVAHVMAELITNNELWRTWQGQMPAVYNADATG
jgi:hypothetical protein